MKRTKKDKPIKQSHANTTFMINLNNKEMFDLLRTWKGSNFDLGQWMDEIEKRYDDFDNGQQDSKVVNYTRAVYEVVRFISRCSSNNKLFYDRIKQFLEKWGARACIDAFNSQGIANSLWCNMLNIILC